MKFKVFDQLFTEYHPKHRVFHVVPGTASMKLSRNFNSYSLRQLTMFRMVLREKLVENLEFHIQLSTMLIDKATKSLDEIVLLYTNGQPAQPSTLAHYLGAIIEVVIRDMRRINSALHDVDLCPMGAGAITTSGFDLDRGLMAELLGFRDCVENSYGAIAACDYITASYSALKLSCIHLGRFVQDLATWTGFEISQLYVPDGFVQVSSIMPQKRNPVPTEHMRLMFSLAAGGANQIIDTMHNTPFADMNDSERETQSTGHQVFDRMNRALKLLSGFVDAVQVNKASVKKRIDDSLATITELADSMVRHEKINFRQAHAIAHLIAKASIKGKIPLKKFSYDSYCKYFESEIGSAPRMKPLDFKRVSDPGHFVDVRKLRGGPSRNAMLESLKKYKRQSEEIYTTSFKYNERISMADRLREDTARNLFIH
jgi:argininosuccinate lyase